MTPRRPDAAPLTDEQINLIAMKTRRRYEPLLGVSLASHIAAARMGRLMARRAS